MHALCPPSHPSSEDVVGLFSMHAICIVPLSLQTASMEISFGNRSIGTRSTNPTCPVHAEREGSARPYVLPLSTAYISASIFCVSCNCPATAIQPSELPHLLPTLLDSSRVHWDFENSAEEIHPRQVPSKLSLIVSAAQGADTQCTSRILERLFFHSWSSY